MLKIKISDFEATFDEGKWTSNDSEVAEVLNGFLPEYSISDIMMDEQGEEGIALKSIQFLKPDIVKMEPRELPGDVDNIVV